MRTRRVPLPVIGWREWVALPDLGVEAIKVKVDTGARTSSLHAHDMELFMRGGEEWVRFAVHTGEEGAGAPAPAEVRVVEHRAVRNSGGQEERRPVIVTPVELAGERWPIEVTLTRRDSMGFRMLLGRQAIRRRFTVDPGVSFRAGRRTPS